MTRLLFMLLINMTVAGGFLIVARAGAPGFGFDGRFSSEAGSH
jgi:hypothetical protein